MKVLYVLKRYPRLSETFVLREILGIEAQGVRVCVDALMEPEDGPVHDEVATVRAPVRYLPRRARLLGDGVAAAALRLILVRPGAFLRELRRTARLDRAGTPKAWRRFRHAVLVADRARRENVTHLHCHFATAAAEVAVPAGRLAGLPASVTAHAKDIYHRDNAQQLSERLAGAAAVVTVSSYNLRHLTRVLPGAGARPLLRHVPNGVETRPLERLAVGDPDAPLLCVSRLVPKKGIDTLLDAVAAAAPGDTRLRLDVIGDGPLMSPLVDQAERLGISDRVRFLGALPSDRVERAYAACSMVVLPCRIDADGDRDGLPTVLVEALGRGVPVISTEVVGIPEVVVHGRTGLLVQPDDADALAAAIGKLREDPLLARWLGTNGHRLVSVAFCPSYAARRLVDVWREVSA